MSTNTAPAVQREDDPDRLIRLDGCLALVGVRRTFWLELVRRGVAPKPLKLGRATLWREVEVREFVRARVRESTAVKPHRAR